MWKKKKLWISLAAAIIVISGAWYGYTKLKGNNQLNQQQSTRTAAVTKGNISSTVSGTGTVAAAEKEIMKASVEGIVKEVLVQKGDVVKKGQKLVTFEEKDMSSQIKQEQVNLKKKQLDLETAQLNLKKQAQDGSDNIDDQKINITKMQLDIESSVQKIEDYKKEQAAPDPIVAPIDGKITSMTAEVGADIKANGEILQVINLDKLNVAIQVDELDIVKMKPGMTAEVSLDALPGKTVEGQVIEVADEGTAQNGVSLFTVTISLNTADNIKVGMSAQSIIKVEEKKDALLLPIEAVQQVQGKYFVFMPIGENADGAKGATGTNSANDANAANSGSGASGATDANRADRTNGRNRGNFTGGNGGTTSSSTTAAVGRRPTPVEVGIHNETMIEIVSGLKEGDKVILPTLVSSSSSQQNVRVGGGFGGFGGGGGNIAIPRNSAGGGRSSGGGGGNK